MVSNANAEINPAPGTSASMDDPEDSSFHSPSTEKVHSGKTITQPQPEHGTTLADVHQSVGLSVIEQTATIPQTGERLSTSRKEYWSYILYYVGGQGAGVVVYAGAVQQALLYEKFPAGSLQWGGKTTSLASELLDMNGILFGIQLVVLLFLAPYADYGSWRPWVLIITTVMLWVTTLAFAGLRNPDAWAGANALFILGNLALAVSNVFYYAAFPGLVRDLPKMVKSQDEVMAGTRNPDDHAQLDMLERSKMYNYVQIFGSLAQIVLLGICTGVAYKIGTNTPAQLDLGYRVLIGMFGGVTVVTTLPYMAIMKHRPGQRLPNNTSWLAVGPKQLFEAARYAWSLKQTLLYLLAYFILQDANATSGTVIAILQNNTIQFSTEKTSALGLINYFTGCTGTILVNWVQQRYKISVKTMLRFGTFWTVLPIIWGFIGIWTKAIGYHHQWEFWALAAYNFSQCAWGSYNAIMITEVAPAPKIYLFYALFQAVGVVDACFFKQKTSGFIGPFIGSAIIDDAHGNPEAVFYLLLPMILVGYILLWMVNPDKAKIDNAKFLEREARDLYGLDINSEKNMYEMTAVLES